MSHQTGITANCELKKVFSKAQDGKIRAIKVSIENEELTCARIFEAQKDWEHDFDVHLSPSLEECVPCYFLYRFDEKNSLGFTWLLFMWVPDSSTVRQKMLYASTKATLKTLFGSGHIKEEQHATSLDETNLAGYYKNKKAFAAPAPLTMREEQLNEIKKTEVVEVNTETRLQTLGSINCPLADSSIKGIQNMAEGLYDYLQFRIDLEEEKIYLCKATNVELAQLPNEIPNDHARYHLYLFKHTHEGDYLKSAVFIYSMPGYSCSVKERMMYSSCKSAFLESVQILGVEVSKKLEIDDGADLTEEYLQDELHPKKILHKPLFSRPKGPPNRGAKRLTKLQQ